MTNTPFPTVAAWTLPDVLRAPIPAESAPEPVQTASPEHNEATVEALAPLISAAIARRARQRRYTG